MSLKWLRIILTDPIVSLLLGGVVISLLVSILQPYALYLIPLFIIITVFYVFMQRRDLYLESLKETIPSLSFENMLVHVLIDILDEEGNAKAVTRIVRRNISDALQSKCKHEISQDRDISWQELNVRAYRGDDTPLPPPELLQEFPQRKEFNVILDKEIEPWSSPFYYYYTYDWPKVFPKEKEWYDWLFDKPTRELIMEVKLPEGYPLRSPKSFELPQTGISGEIGPPIFNVITSPDNRILLRLHKKHPKIDCIYRIEWTKSKPQ